MVSIPRNTQSSSVQVKRRLTTRSEEVQEVKRHRRQDGVNAGASQGCQGLEAIQEDRDATTAYQQQVISHLSKITRLLEEIATQQRDSIRQMRTVTETTGLQQVRIEAIQSNLTKKATQGVQLYASLEASNPVSDTPVSHTQADPPPEHRNNNNEVRRSDRIRKKPSRLDDYV
ncbi:unnamed protein product [Macrosiphum euphorbiae]|uniref:Uncharacterized protein n=1 Tax=Macrosiphum euphorbiae TaxID=13131 RepID=A0AAV0XLG0_9HEMI|nr:unnamed protein product [Macrosiphum euphorbiae]